MPAFDHRFIFWGWFRKAKIAARLEAAVFIADKNQSAGLTLSQPLGCAPAPSVDHRDPHPIWQHHGKIRHSANL
jgi:hypothetical protein